MKKSHKLRLKHAIYIHQFIKFQDSTQICKSFTSIEIYDITSIAYYIDLCFLIDALIYKIL